MHEAGGRPGQRASFGCRGQVHPPGRLPIPNGGSLSLRLLVRPLCIFSLHCVPYLPNFQVDPAELEDARWFHADWLAAATGMGGQHAPAPAVVRAASSGNDVPFRIPGRYALANRLIRAWLEGRRASQTAQTAAALGEQQASAAAALQALAAIPDVNIDEGSFKYVLLRLSTPDGEAPPGSAADVVLGPTMKPFARHPFHKLQMPLGPLLQLLLRRPAQQAAGAWGQPRGVPQPRAAGHGGRSAGRSPRCRPAVGDSR